MIRTKAAGKKSRKKPASKAAKAAAHGRAKSPRAKMPRSKAPSAKSKSEEAARALAVLERLRREFPDAKCALDHETPHQLLVATILSAQCTDARVNLVTKDLFRKYRSPKAFAEANPETLENDIRSTGFFRMKARAILEMSRDIETHHHGEVPRTMEELIQLRGVGRKTANVVLGNAFGVPGVVVDTHVMRLSQRLGFTRETDPVKIERDLDELWPQSWWTLGSHLLILHGRKTCTARKPQCPECPVNDLCPSAHLFWKNLP
jgi:endonuclease-3